MAAISNLQNSKMAKYTADEVMDGLNELHDSVAFHFGRFDKRIDDLRDTMNRRFDKVDDRFDEMKADFSEMKVDFSAMKADFSEMKVDFSEMKADFGEVKADITEIKSLIVREPKRRKR